MYALLDLHYEVPALFALNFRISKWEAFSYDYLSNMFGGLLKMGDFSRPSYVMVGNRRLALNRRPDGVIIWRPPLSFNMNSTRCYWRLNIAPRLEAGVERQSHAIALERTMWTKRKAKHESQVGAEPKVPGGKQPSVPFRREVPL